MKIALIYSGAVRTLSETISNNVEYFSRLGEVDLWFSLCDYPGCSDRINSPDYIYGKRKFDAAHKITKEDIELIAQGYQEKVKEIRITKQPNAKINLLNGCDEHLAIQYFKILESYQMVRDSGIEYDVMVRMRCDLLLNNQISKEEFSSSISQGILHTENIWYEHSRKPHHLDINEMIWAAKPELFEKTCNIYLNGSKMSEIISQRKQDFHNYGENICFLNLEAEDLVEKVRLFDFDYQVVR